MNVVPVRLNGGFNFHLVDIDQKTFPGDRKLKALCGHAPGGGKTRMGASRSRWLKLPADTKVECEKCNERFAAMKAKPCDT